MRRTFTISALVALTLGLGSTVALAAPDPVSKTPTDPVAAAAQPAKPILVADALSSRPAKPSLSQQDEILYDIFSDQIGQMRRKSALPATMCIAVSADDGSAGTAPRTVMAKLESDNAKFADTLFTLKSAGECTIAGERMVDRDTHERAMMIVAGPMESEMKELMSGCGDFVGGFVRASGDSDFDFYSANGGDVARKLGCELAQ